MVRRRAAEPRVQPLALPLSAAGVPLRRTWWPRTAAAGKHDPEYELLDTGAFDDDRYWIVEVDYAKASPTDLLMAVRVTNAGPEADTIHVLPTVWFRNTWSWDDDDADARARAPARRRRDRDRPPAVRGPRAAGRRRARRHRRRRCCSARTRRTRRGSTATRDGSPFPKDGINDHVVDGARHRQPRPGRAPRRRAGTSVDVEPGATVELRLRLRPRGGTPATDIGRRSARLRQGRRDRAAHEADEFYAELTPAGRERRRGGRHAPGVRRDAVVEAALLLRRRPLARRRPDPTGATRVAA